MPAVSLARAFNCIGRQVQSFDNTVKGFVERVDKYHVYVSTTDGIVTCNADDLVWSRTIPDGLAEAISEGEDYESAQVVLSWQLDTNQDDWVGDMALVYSPPHANDDDDVHSLYVFAAGMQRVIPVRITASMQFAWEAEELLGWQQP